MIYPLIAAPIEVLVATPVVLSYRMSRPGKHGTATRVRIVG